MKSFFCALVIFLSGFLFGQDNRVEVKGKVISDKKEIVSNAELYLKVNDSVYKTITDQNGEYKFSIIKSKTVAELYINATKRTVGSASKKSCFLDNKMIYKINLADKTELTYDFELKLAGIYYSTPSILFKSNSSYVVLDVRYGNVSANIEEVMEYFYKLIKEYPKMILSIDGMMSSDEKTDNLSLLRAKYVADLLIKKGAIADNLKCNGRGTSLPDIASNIIQKAKTKTEEERLSALNRRVVIKVLTLGAGVEGDRKKNND